VPREEHDPRLLLVQWRAPLHPPPGRSGD
jgi:hypothetical protein